MDIEGMKWKGDYSVVIDMKQDENDIEGIKLKGDYSHN